MDEIRVGEYIRTNGGNIYQIRKIEKSISAIGRTAYWVKEFYLLKEDIKSHSKNIIDLIEVGDIVQYKELFTYERWGAEKGKIYILSLTSENEIEKFRKCVENKEIEFISILTHEMYENNCYKVGED